MSKREYEQYLANGRVFRHARHLRDNNQKILNLITSDDFDLGPDLTSAIGDLTEHLQDWARCWDKENDLRTPKDDDVFVFTGYKTYPKHLDALLQAHCD
ncbi:hypothetical protein HW561_02385 [Rhodobacteraceae bacterium B1Z28]|uniref:Uncharacterized protein n=1 Tax=Ruegeria haliotis TaxID=2747601 RepID=A0ABX2PME9_9RHOB|nr:hypothetical protein [Ruegeria haliotis]NVO54636.1 hypothetical protein [Ruegeria haliotis]